MRRKATTLLILSAAAGLASGCVGARPLATAPAEPGKPLWSAGAGDTLGATSFHKPVIVAAYEARRADDAAFAAAPTD